MGGKSPWQVDEACLSPDQIPLSIVIPSLFSEAGLNLRVSSSFLVPVINGYFSLAYNHSEVSFMIRVKT